MKLETHEGVFSDPATAQDISRAVAGLTEVGKAYVILDEDDGDDEVYVQAAGTIAKDFDTVSEDFILERRDGRAGEHYRCDRRVTADELVTVLTAYLNRDPDWSGSLTWHRVRVDQDTPSA